jgi:hypothetical protein
MSKDHQLDNFHCCHFSERPHPNPLPSLREGARVRFPFSQVWEKGLGDEGKKLDLNQSTFLIPILYKNDLN